MMIHTRHHETPTGKDISFRPISTTDFYSYVGAVCLSQLGSVVPWYHGLMASWSPASPWTFRTRWPQRRSRLVSAKRPWLYPAAGVPMPCYGAGQDGRRTQGFFAVGRLEQDLLDYLLDDPCFHQHSSWGFETWFLSGPNLILFFDSKHLQRLEVPNQIVRRGWCFLSFKYFSVKLWYCRKSPEKNHSSWRRIGTPVLRPKPGALFHDWDVVVCCTKPLSSAAPLRRPYAPSLLAGRRWAP